MKNILRYCAFMTLCFLFGFVLSSDAQAQDSIGEEIVSLELMDCLGTVIPLNDIMQGKDVSPSDMQVDPKRLKKIQRCMNGKGIPLEVPNEDQLPGLSNGVPVEGEEPFEGIGFGQAAEIVEDQLKSQGIDMNDKDFDIDEYRKIRSSKYQIFKPARESEKSDLSTKPVKKNQTERKYIYVPSQ